MKSIVKKSKGSVINALAGLGLLASIYYGAEAHKNLTFQRLHQYFPTYVAEYEQKYGPFERQPQLIFDSIPSTAMAYGDNRVVLNDSTFRHLFGHKREKDRPSTIKHELGHLILYKIIKEVNPDWLQVDDDGLRVSLDKIVQENVISEGIAEYIAIQNDGSPVESYNPHNRFVKPVLDELGLDKGIRKLLLEPPTHDELENPISYYKRLKLNPASYIEYGQESSIKSDKGLNLNLNKIQNHMNSRINRNYKKWRLMSYTTLHVRLINHEFYTPKGFLISASHNPKDYTNIWQNHS